mmetsp:Transcript_32412/g.63348  ORF Transcript_32412/g.63348 Transcript_32412/m.63348 type:complete len:208 (-) Transcript_32412:1219-1842(-)
MYSSGPAATSLISLRASFTNGTFSLARCSQKPVSSSSSNPSSWRTRTITSPITELGLTVLIGFSPSATSIPSPRAGLLGFGAAWAFESLRALSTCLSMVGAAILTAPALSFTRHEPSARTLLILARCQSPRVRERYSTTWPTRNLNPACCCSFLSAMELFSFFKSLPHDCCSYVEKSRDLKTALSSDAIHLCLGAPSLRNSQKTTSL